MTRIFVELPPFRKYIDNINDGGAKLFEIQMILLNSPDEGDVIAGTGGLRKLRVRAAGRGKSGGYRVTYLHLPAFKKLYLITIYAKNEQEDLSSEEKNILRKLVETLKKEVK